MARQEEGRIVDGYGVPGPSFASPLQRLPSLPMTPTTQGSSLHEDIPVNGDWPTFIVTLSPPVDFYSICSYPVLTPSPINPPETVG